MMSKLLPLFLTFWLGCGVTGDANAKGKQGLLSQSEAANSVERFAAAVGMNHMLDASLLPFLFRSSDKVKHCEGELKTDQEVKAWTVCMKEHWNLLLETFAQRKLSEVRFLKGTDLPNFAASILPLDASSSIVRAGINGDGVTFLFVFRIENKNRKVTAMMVDTEFPE